MDLDKIIVSSSYLIRYDELTKKKFKLNNYNFFLFFIFILFFILFLFFIIYYFF